MGESTELVVDEGKYHDVVSMGKVERRGRWKGGEVEEFSLSSKGIGEVT